MTGITYNVIEIFTSEQARWKGSPLYDAIVQVIAKEKTAVRCIVSRGVAGCFENGEIASHRVLDLSHNMPLKIEIILPKPELQRILSRIEHMVTDGIILVEESDVRVHRTTGDLLPRGLLVRDVMTAAPISVGTGTGLQELVSVLVRSELDGVPVLDREERLAGLVTQEDLEKKAGLSLKPKLMAELWQGTQVDEVSREELFAGKEAFTAGEIMTRHTPSVGPDAPLNEAVKIMAQGNLKRLPIVDGEKHLQGMLARIDVLRVALASSSRRRALENYGVSVTGTAPVRDAILLDVPTVSPDTPASVVMELIDNEGQRVVVVDDAGSPLGAISDRDLLPLLGPKGADREQDLSAGDLMTAVPTVTQETSVEQALELMVERRRKRLPVVDSAGKYIGMLGREELLRMLAPEP